MTKQELKDSVALIVKTNSNREISGANLQAKLFEIIDECYGSGGTSSLYDDIVGLTGIDFNTLTGDETFPLSQTSSTSAYQMSLNELKLVLTENPFFDPVFVTESRYFESTDEGKLLVVFGDNITDTILSMPPSGQIFQGGSLWILFLAKGGFQIDPNSNVIYPFSISPDGNNLGQLLKFTAYYDTELLSSGLVEITSTDGFIVDPLDNTKSISTINYLMRTISTIGGSSLNLNEIGFGTGTGIASSVNFTFDDINKNFISGSGSNSVYKQIGSSIIGGSTNLISDTSGLNGYNNTISGGQNNTINDCSNSVILGGQNLILNDIDNIVLVPILRIDNVANDNTNDRILSIDVDNNVVYRDLSTIFSRKIFNISTITTSENDLNVDYVYNISGGATLTLPTAVGNKSEYKIKNVDVISCDIVADLTETIDGASSITLSNQYDSVTIISDGTNWLIY